MARIPVEAGISSSSPPSGSGSGHAVLPGSPDVVPSHLQLPAPKRGSPRQTWLLAAATVLAVLGVAAFAVPAAGVGHGRLFAGAGAITVLLLAGVLFALGHQHAAVAAEAALWERRAQEARQRAAEQQQRAVSWEQRAGQAEKRAVELDLLAGEQENHARTVTAGLVEAADYLLHVHLPAVLDGFAAPPTSSANGAAGDEAAALFARIGAAVEEGVAKLREQVSELRQRSDDHRESSRRAVLTLARLLQASALRIQAQSAKMAEDRPADPGVLEASMRVEHAAAQMARNSQSLVVLCGEWPGQQWPDPLALPDVVRAAAGRIMSYQRVNVSGDHAVAADAGVVEPLIHLVAELLANATQSSPPATQVEVTVQAVQHGAVIEIDDRGIGMEEAQFRQTRELLSGTQLVGLGDLGEFPQTGLAVIGHYVQRHGFGVELRKSPYGGVRAVVLVPDPLVVNNVEPVTAARPALTAPLPPSPSAQAGLHQAGVATPGRRLPRRQSLRGQALPGGHEGPAPADSPAVPVETTPEQEGDFLAAYLGAGDAAATPGAGEQDAALPDETER